MTPAIDEGVYTEKNPLFNTKALSETIGVAENVVASKIPGVIPQSQSEPVAIHENVITNPSYVTLSCVWHAGQTNCTFYLRAYGGSTVSTFSTGNYVARITGVNQDPGNNNCFWYGSYDNFYRRSFGSARGINGYRFTFNDGQDDADFALLGGGSIWFGGKSAYQDMGTSYTKVTAFRTDSDNGSVISSVGLPEPRNSGDNRDTANATVGFGLGPSNSFWSVYGGSEYNYATGYVYKSDSTGSAIQSFYVANTVGRNQGLTVGKEGCIFILEERAIDYVGSIYRFDQSGNQENVFAVVEPGTGLGSRPAPNF